MGLELRLNLHRQHGLLLVEPELAEVVRLAALLALDAVTVGLFRLPLPVQDLRQTDAATRSAYGTWPRCSKKRKGWLDFFLRKKEHA